MTNHQLDQQIATDAERYRKLRAWVIENGYYEASNSCDAGGPLHDCLYGPTFDAAVDALPEPEEK